jgi:hypothetical protein
MGDSGVLHPEELPEIDPGEFFCVFVTAMQAAAGQGQVDPTRDGVSPGDDAGPVSRFGLADDPMHRAIMVAKQEYGSDSQRLMSIALRIMNVAGLAGEPSLSRWFATASHDSDVAMVDDALIKAAAGARILPDGGFDLADIARRAEEFHARDSE